MTAERWPTRLWRWLCWALDLECPSGEPDFAKMMQALTQVVMLAAIWQEKPLLFGICLALIISAHGSRMLMAAIKAGVFSVRGTVTEATSHTITETRAGRDEKAGLELTP